MSEGVDANYRITLLHPMGRKTVEVLRRHVKLSLGQALSVSQSKVDYILPYDYTEAYASTLARDFDSVGTRVRIASDREGDVTSRILGRRDGPPPPPVGRKHPVAKVLGGLVVIGFVLVVGIAIVAALFGDSKSASSSASNTPTSSPSPPPVADTVVRVSARELFSQYQANEVAADEVYKDKTLLVSGTVQSISKDFLDKVFVVLRTPNEFMGVHAELDERQRSTASALSRGQPVTFRCVGGGMIVGSPVLKDCVLDSSPH